MSGGQGVPYRLGYYPVNLCRTITRPKSPRRPKGFLTPPFHPTGFYHPTRKNPCNLFWVIVLGQVLSPFMSSLHSGRYRTLVVRLREARLRAGLTQVRVAELLGKPQSFVSKIEQGERRLDPIELVDLARLYKASLADLLSGLDEPEGAHPLEQARRPHRKNRRRVPEESD